MRLPHVRLRWPTRQERPRFSFPLALVLPLLIGLGASAMQVAAATAPGGGLAPLVALDSASQDLLLRTRANQSLGTTAVATSSGDPRAFITIIAIDDRTIAELGAYNGGYPRRYYAHVVDNLLAAPPRVIAFDLGFFEPTEDDPLLAAALDHARSLPVPTSVILATAGLAGDGAVAAYAAGGELAFDASLQPVPMLAERADLALANIVPDEQGTIRSVPLQANAADIERPTLGLAATAAYLRHPATLDARDGQTARFAGRTVPVASNMTMRIGYVGPPSVPNRPDSTFRVVSFVDVLRSRIDPAMWRGGLVLIGALGATGLADDYWTPMSQQGRKMAGVEIHANVAATLFSTRFLQDLALPLSIVVILAVSASVGLLTVCLGALTACLGACALLLAYAGGVVFALYADNLLLPIATPLLAGLLSLVSGIAARLASEQRQARRLRADVARGATHDALTGLTNRIHFHDRLTDALRSAAHDHRRGALLVMDLDRFKDVNDALGHLLGDALLREIGDRLRRATPACATVARLGGDQFAVLLPDADVAAAIDGTERLVEALRTPVDLDGREVVPSLSVGVVAFAEHGDDPGTLLRCAELAMYRARQAGRCFDVYTRHHDQPAADRLTLVNDFRHAADNGELIMHFQPKIGCRSGHLAGVEALVRWRHPRFGLLGPDRFIGLAEETQYIGQLTRWALSVALGQCRTWLDAGLEVPVAVNVSALDLQDERLPGLIGELLNRHRVAAGNLVVEITETALLVEPDRALLGLEQLATLGVGVSLDDFGTGYSSLSYLKQFPVHQLKIDRSLVTDITTKARDRAIVESTIELGHRLGLILVAEGVEDATTLELLGTLECDQAQGYYIGRPMPGDDLGRWLAGWSRDVRLAA